MARRNAVELGHRPAKHPVSALTPTLDSPLATPLGRLGSMGTPSRGTGFAGRLRAALRGKAAPLPDVDADIDADLDTKGRDEDDEEATQDLAPEQLTDDLPEDAADDGDDALSADLDDDAGLDIEVDADDELAAVGDDNLSAGAELDVELSDNVGEASVEINVESLLLQLEEDRPPVSKATPACSARRKLEDYMERKRIARALEDFEDFEV